MSMSNRPTLGLGSHGSFVITVQDCLELVTDGDYGPDTCEAVHIYQIAHDLQSDGVVGDATWQELEEQFDLPPYPPPLLPPLRPDVAEMIMEVAATSPVATISWEDRGVAPIGYVKGMALAFAHLLQNLAAGDSSAVEMAKANTGDKDEDALAWYADVFTDLEMDNSKPGPDTLRHLFVLLWGLGIRESNGRHCEGRDLSADNTTSDTAEAGLFQMSWNASGCSDEMEKLYDQFSAAGYCKQCLRQVFTEDVSCTNDEWACYGSGAGCEYQRMAKFCPQFAVETTAVGLRNLRQHWGPINRFEAQVLPEVDALLREIQMLIEDRPVA
jgi:hypothetical protein